MLDSVDKAVAAREDFGKIPAATDVDWSLPGHGAVVEAVVPIPFQSAVFGERIETITARRNYIFELPAVAHLPRSRPL